MDKHRIRQAPIIHVQFQFSIKFEMALITSDCDAMRSPRIKWP